MKKYISNIVWMGTERIISIIGGLAITVYAARYLGPEKMGMFNFSLALISIIIPVCQFGGDTLIFNRIASNFTGGVRFLKSTITTRLILYFLMISALFFFCFIRNYSEDQLKILALMMISCFFSSQDVYRIFFDATLNSKVNSLSAQAGLYASFFIRFFLIKFQASFIWFSFPYILNTLIPFVIRKMYFSKKTQNIKIKKKGEKKYLNYLISAGLPLTVSGLSIVIYTKISQVILAEQLSVESVAIYNAATTIGQGWNFFPLAIITTLMTKVSQDKKNFLKGLGFVYLICSLIAIPIIMIYLYFSEGIIFYTYGSAYQDAAKIMPLISISSLFSILGTASYRGIVLLGGYKYLMWKMFLMAVLNVSLSIVFIRHYGLHGAVYSLLLTEFISCTIANYFFKKGVILKAQTGILNSYKYINRFT